jgi:hypothetical protein
MPRWHRPEMRRMTEGLPVFRIFIIRLRSNFPRASDTMVAPHWGKSERMGRREPRGRILWWLLVAACGILATSFFIGLWIGRKNAPDYSNPQSALFFLWNHARIDKQDSQDVQLSVTAGTYRYQYTLSSNQVKRVALDPIALAKVPTASRWKFLEEWKIADVISSGVSGIAAHKVADHLKEIKSPRGRALYLIGALVLASGGIGGFYITHNDPGDYNNKTFVETLTDPNSWSGWATKIRDCDVLAKIKTGALADDSSCEPVLEWARNLQQAQ